MNQEPSPESPAPAVPGSTTSTPRRLNTANAATQNPQSGTRFISSCNRCRRRKIKCDPGIPSCHACTESNTTCEYHDMTNNADMPRARIIGLEQHLQHLLEQEAQVLQQPNTQATTVNVDGVFQPEFRGRLVVSGIRLACTFCRKRKIKCDGTAPCAGCTKFGRPNECSILYEEASSQGRSYISYLEERISKIGRQLSAHYGPHQTSTSGAPGGTVPMPYGQDVMAYQTDPQLLQATSDGRELVDGGASDRPDPSSGLQDMALQNLSDQSNVLSGQNLHASWTFRVSLLSMIGFRDDTGPFTSPLGRDVVQPLVQHYITDVHPSLPLLHLPELHRNVENYYQNKASTIGQFMVLMVIAIAASNMSEHPTSTATWDALKFFSTASHAAAYEPESLQGLEATLLVVQFATLNPSRMNAWYLTSIALRTCATLGLHREATKAELQVDLERYAPEHSASLPSDPTEKLAVFAGHRRRLFWAAYGYDRLQCITTGRPSGFEDNAITLDLPKGTGKLGSSDPVDVSIQRLSIVRLQSTLYSRLYQGEKDVTLPEDEAEAYVASLAKEIDEWRTRSKSDSPHVQVVMNLEDACARLLLYRPCEAIPTRKEEHLERLAATSVDLIDLTYKFVHGSVKPFHTQYMIPRIYCAGIALMHSTYRQVAQSDDGPSKADLHMILSKANSLLFHFAERWQVGIDLARKFAALHQSFSEYYKSSGSTAIADEIRLFYQFRLGSLQRNRPESSPDWTQVMHRILSGDSPDGHAGMPSTQQSNVDPALSAPNTPYGPREHRTSISASTGNTPQGMSATAPFQSSRPGSQPQANPYGSASPYAPSQAQQQFSNPYYYPSQSPTAAQASQNFQHHLPHQPSLQQGQAHGMTPLQQLAATAMDHPEQREQQAPPAAQKDA